MYTTGQIIDRKEHIAFANWKAVNGGNLISVSLGSGQYRIEEDIELEKTIEELSKEKRNQRNFLLGETDKFTSIPDYPITEEERKQYILYRQYLRDIPQQETFPNIEILNFEDWLLTQENK